MDFRAWLIRFSIKRGAIRRAPSHGTEEPDFRGVIGSSDCKKGGHVDVEFNNTGPKKNGVEMENVNSVSSYYLGFSGFLIEVRIDVQSSMDFTKRFDHHGLDFAFAVAEVWLHHEGEKHLIFPATHPGNFLESLKGLDKLVSNPPSVPGMEALMPCGGWCSWMAGYWDRIENECNTAEDEQLYDLLIPLSFLESRVGHIAVYRYGDKNIFEVAVRASGHEGSPTVGVWSQFSPDALGNEIVHLEKVIAADIRDAIKMQPL